MLFKAAILAKIQAGEVSLAFRRWVKPTVKAGSNLKTPIGILDIKSVKTIELADLTTAQARKAGYKDLESLMKDLLSRPTGLIYRIDLRYSGEDPRLSLRKETQLSTEDVAILLKKIRSMDSRRPSGPWVKHLLKLILDQPGTRAADLAESLGQETLKLKSDVRKLKNLGLTISLGTGYKISPRGRVALKLLGR